MKTDNKKKAVQVEDEKPSESVLLEVKYLSFDKPQVHYNKDTGRIISMYEAGVNYHHVPEPYVEISMEDRDKILYDMHLFSVINGKIIDRKFTQQEQNEKLRIERQKELQDLSRKLDILDFKRIRPLAEPDIDDSAEILAELNAKITPIRDRIKEIIAELKTL